MAAPCPTLPGRAEPLATQPRALPNLSLKEQPQIVCMKGGEKTRFEAWLCFKAMEDMTVVQQLAAWFKGNQDKPAPGVFTAICLLACAPCQGTGKAESRAARDGCPYPARVQAGVPASGGCSGSHGVPAAGAARVGLCGRWQGFPKHLAHIQPCHAQPWLQLGKSIPSRSPGPHLRCPIPAKDGERRE